mgnify:CR=1 FL=1
MNQLFERVDFIVKEKTSRTQLASMPGIPQQTFNSHFHSPRGKASTAPTGRLCELRPDVSRKRPETGEEVIHQAVQPTAEECAALKAELEAGDAEIERLRSEPDEERRLNRTLTAKLLLGDSTEGSAVSSAKSAGGQQQ